MFILRTTSMPTLAQLTQIEQIVAVDLAGPNQPVSLGSAQAASVGEALQGPFVTKIMNSPGDLKAYYQSAVPGRFVLQSQNTVNAAADSSTPIQDGSGVAFDGNIMAELKGKTFTGLAIQRVDCDMVSATPSTTKVFVKFSVVVDASDTTGSVTNKDIVIPSGQRFADNSTPTVVIATSQEVHIPAGTTIVGGAVVCGVNFVQDAASGMLTYSTTGTLIGVTAFFVKGTSATTAGTNLIDTLVDTAIPGVVSVVGGTVSTIGANGSAADAYAAAGGAAAPSPDTLANRIAACYPAAINKTLPGTQDTSSIIAIWSARNWAMSAANAQKTMRNNLWQNAIASSTGGRGRVACVTVAPALGVLASDATTAKALYTGLKTADSIAASNADADRFWICGPFAQVWSDELAKDITISACGARAAMKVNLFNAGKSEYQTSVGPSENNQLQAVDSVEACFLANPPQEADFIAFKANGVAWFTRDPSAGWWFYSGVTAADPIQYQNRVADNRRSFADEIQDIIFSLANKYAKKPGTQQRSDAFMTDMVSYLEALKTPGIGDQRCKNYQVLEGAAAGNTDTLNAHGVFLFEADVQMFGDMNALVVKAMIGPNVIISQASAG
jgi:hypothetical protein